MSYKEIYVLIPCHSLEDFPEDLGDSASESLLNAFAVAWHPALINSSGVLPRWYRADEPPMLGGKQLFLLPEPSEGWAPCDFEEQVSASGGKLIKGARTRAEYLEAVELPLPEAGELTHDFFALGSIWLLVELLTRKMRNYGNVDEYRLKERSALAARAWEANDRATAELNLKTCFTILQEAREQFYPVDCYLLDLCLVPKDEPVEPLERLVDSKVAVNLLSTGQDWRVISEKSAGLAGRIAESWGAGELALLGGELTDYISPLTQREVVIDQLEAGRAEYLQLFGRAPKVWGRRTFGLTPGIPQLLRHFGYTGALHLVLDDGVYPDEELSQFRWQGVDDTVISAFSRIPLAGDAASSWMRLPSRLGESMDHDHIAAISLARWPDLRQPWLEDLRRTQKYGHPLGRFATFEEFFALNAMPGKQKKPGAGEYFSPMLWQDVARRSINPLLTASRRLEHSRSIDAAEWCAGVAAAIGGLSIPSHDEAGLLRRRNLNVRAGTDEDAGLSREVSEYLAKASHNLARQLVSRPLLEATDSTATPTGYLLINTLSFPRRTRVELPHLQSPPPAKSEVKISRVTSADGSRPGMAMVDLPPAGYCWIPADGKGPATIAPSLPLAERWILRNDKFEISLNEQSGGIRQVREHVRRVNHLSQLVSYRFPREKSFTTATGENEKTLYAQMHCDGCTVLESDSVTGAVETTGTIVDPASGVILTRFRQVVRVWRGWTGISLEIELIEPKLVEGNPWHDCFVTRFAINDSTSVLTRSVWEAAQSIKGERIEGGDYLEFASDAERVTIIPHGLPYHRKVGDRVVDTLLAVAGEATPRSRFTILFDETYPQSAALDASVPVAIIPTYGGNSPATRSAWLMHIDMRSVQLKRLLPSPRVDENSQEKKFVVELLETEGQQGMGRLITFAAVSHARKIDAAGETLVDLVIETDAIMIEFRPYEMCWVEVTVGQG